MKLYEHEAADIFSGFGIRVPERILATTPDEAVMAAEKIGLPVVVKAQILAGGRGLAGGVQPVATVEEAQSVAARLLNSRIQGIKVRAIMVVRKVDYYRELYLGITVDGFNGRPLAMVSTKGGMNIEEVAHQNPANISSMGIPVDRGLFAFEARKLFKTAGFPSRQIPACADTLVRLYHVFETYNAMVAEINPLVICTNESLMAVDAKLEIDDSSLYRTAKLIPKNHDRNESYLEKLGRDIGVSYVELDGDIGIISSGAGLGMATMDIIGHQLRPANFLETGGAITEDLLYKTMDLVLTKKGLRAVFINLYGGINPIHQGAKGIVRYVKEHDVRIPIVAKALGNRQKETWDILRSGGVHVVTDVATETAVAKLIELLE
ncbi:MAG: acetate--CoA ligase family protein [Desulfobacterales bacterium]|jgi:succinyl-CoA synthetase beta subunit